LGKAYTYLRHYIMLSPTSAQARQNNLIFLAGGTAGIIAKTAVAPLERVKLLYQAGVPATSVWSTLQRVSDAEGFRGLWRGNMSSCYRVFPNKGIMFSMNDFLKSPNSLARACPAWSVPMLSGALAGAMADALTYPLDLSRTRQSCKIGTNRYNSFSSTMTLTVREEGFRALYRGFGVTLFSCIPYEGIRFGCYDLYTRWLSQFLKLSTFSAPLSYPMAYLSTPSSTSSSQPSVFGKALCGSLAGTTAVLLTFPNDTIRRRMQLQGSDSSPVRARHFVHCYSLVIREEGARALYRGMAATLLRSVPNTAIQFTVYDFLRALVCADPT